jgi:hypothetical protein
MLDKGRAHHNMFAPLTVPVSKRLLVAACTTNTAYELQTCCNSTDKCFWLPLRMAGAAHCQASCTQHLIQTSTSNAAAKPLWVSPLATPPKTEPLQTPQALQQSYEDHRCDNSQDLGSGFRFCKPWTLNCPAANVTTISDAHTSAV